MIHIKQKIEPVDLIYDNKNYCVADFIEFRERLNTTKSKLDVFYISSKKDKNFANNWNYFQHIIDNYKSLRGKIKMQYNAQNVSNAWLKYYEILNEYKIKDAKKVFFNAELPGSSLCAFNHFMKTSGKDYEWWAASLMPSENNKIDALGDYYGIYELNKSHWLISPEHDGDSTDIKNIEYYSNTIGEKTSVGGVNLYSHDAGIDVSCDSSGNINFNAQETANARIHLGCALAGFLTMRRGADFIAKQYTLFETLTWNLILVYAGLFDEFYLCKPLTSRPYNSEIYLIGKGFKGIDDTTKKILTDKLINFDMKPILSETSTTHLGDIRRFAKRVFNQQINSINDNINLFNEYRFKLGILNKDLKPIKDKRINEWLEKYPVKYIKNSDKIKSNI